MPGNADNSDMIKRILLPDEDDKHMPPREKPQLTNEQIALLHWWIENGDDTLRKVKEMPQPEPIKSYLLALQVGHEEHKLPANIPSAPVEKADSISVQKLKDKGVIILPVAQNSNYISANFVTAKCF